MDSRLFYGYGRQVRASEFIRAAAATGLETEYFNLTRPRYGRYNTVIQEAHAWTREHHGTDAAVVRLAELVADGKARIEAGEPEQEARILLVFSDPNPVIDLLESERFELLHSLAWYVNGTRFVVVGHDGPDDEMEYALDLNPPKEIV